MGIILLSKKYIQIKKPSDLMDEWEHCFEYNTITKEYIPGTQTFRKVAENINEERIREIQNARTSCDVQAPPVCLVKSPVSTEVALTEAALHKGSSIEAYMHLVICIPVIILIFYFLYRYRMRKALNRENQNIADVTPRKKRRGH